MGLTTAMYTGLSGINANQARIDTVGNNIANVNTTAFKSSRTLFQNQYSQLLSAGTPPSDLTGGTNPMQIGLGVVVGSTQRNFSPGSLETTGLNSDAAIEGNGYFVVRRGGGTQAYTRDGSFTVNANNQLVTADGDFVQGFGVDSNFNVVPGTLQDMQIPLGTLSVARATQTARVEGDLSAAGTRATQGSRHLSQALVNAGGAAATAGTRLTDLRSASAPGTALFSNGETITVSGITKGQRELPPQTFKIGTDGTTLGDFATWLQGVTGIQTGSGLPGNPGVRVQGGQLVVEGNAGEPNDLDISLGDVAGEGSNPANPLQFTRTQSANGSGVFTSYTIYDSLGSPVNVQMTFTLDSTPDTGPVWRYYAESADASATNRALGSGTVTFDSNGNFVSADGNQFAIPRTANGATNPLNFTVDLSGMHGLSTSESTAVLAGQDGFPPGTLTGFSIGNDGTITGTFTNGLTRTLGQLALANFANPTGLVTETDNLYLTGPNSGPAQIVTAGTGGTGRVVGGALELSNVDLSNEFINLITSSTGFQASSRVISAANDLLNQLLLISR